MTRRKRMIGAVILLGLMAGLSGEAAAQKPEPAPDAPPSSRPKEERPESPVAEARPDAAAPAWTALLTEFAGHVRDLTLEIRKLRRMTERNTLAIELLLDEERLARLEDKVDNLQDRKAQLDAHDQELQYRLQNIQQEVLLRGGLNIEQGEAAIRSELTRGIQDTHSQQASVQKRMTDAQAEIARLRARIEALRKKLDVPQESDSNEKLL